MGRSSELNLAHQTLHYNDENGKHQYDSKGIPTAFDTTADYHTYGYLWAADWVCWHIDSVESRCLTKGVPTSAAYVILNLGLPDWFGMPDSTTPFPASMDVDWVRVYAQP